MPQRSQHKGQLEEVRTLQNRPVRYARAARVKTYALSPKIFVAVTLPMQAARSCRRAMHTRITGLARISQEHACLSDYNSPVIQRVGVII